ncbi:MAG: hypothetical protein JSV24_01380 [Bacteroidales bacterium]|nr:MAG: hypothetical protein JSV24_01380 [Bacteroidales bacterium]
MRKEKLTELSTENLKNLKRKTFIALWVIILVFLAGIFKVIGTIQTIKLSLFHVIVIGAVIGAIVELIMNSIFINAELKARNKSESDDQTIKH